MLPDPRQTSIQFGFSLRASQLEVALKILYLCLNQSPATLSRTAHTAQILQKCIAWWNRSTTTMRYISAIWGGGGVLLRLQFALNSQPTPTPNWLTHIAFRPLVVSALWGWVLLSPFDSASLLSARSLPAVVHAGLEGIESQIKKMKALLESVKPYNQEQKPVR